MITHLAHVPIFNCSVFFVGDCGHVEAMDAVYHLKRSKTRWEIAEVVGANGGRVGIVAGDVFCYVKDLDFASTVSHELVHIACSIMESRGIPQCRETEEVMCYLVGWLKINVQDRVYQKREKLANG